VHAARAPRWARRPDERPQELLDAALDVFSRQGYCATRLEQVAEAAGVTKGAIYHYFANKEELLLRAFQSRIDTAFGGIEAEARRGGGSVTERLGAVLGAAWARWCMPETARMYRLLMGEMRTELPQLFDVAMRAGPMRVWRLVADLLAEGQRTGECAAGFDPALAARFISSGLMHQALLEADFRERGYPATAPDALFESAMAVAMQGVLATDGGSPAEGTLRRRALPEAEPRPR
jgi:AcrR family transcriptional regulator